MTTGKHCQLSSEWLPFFESGKNQTVKGEGWAPPFISCVQDTVGLEPPFPLPLQRLWETFTFLCKIYVKISSSATQDFENNLLKLIYLKPHFEKKMGYTIAQLGKRRATTILDLVCPLVFPQFLHSVTLCIGYALSFY